MKIKIIASLSIFVVLFSLAWFWDRQHVREFYEPDLTGDDAVVEIMPINYEMNHGPKRYKLFKPREYVRIEEL